MSENAVQVAQEALRAIKAEPVGGARWILGADSNVLFLRGSKQVKGKPAAPYAMVTVFNDGTIKTEIVSRTQRKMISAKASPRRRHKKIECKPCTGVSNPVETMGGRDEPC